MAYVRTRLGRMFFEERGEVKRPGDAAIVLCHGLLFDGGMWKEQIGPLSALGRVVVLDGPGHGKSESPPRFTIEDHADSLLDVYDELKISRAVMVGLSWGGMVAMRMALQHPTRVAAMALLDTSAEVDGLVERVKYRLFVAFARRYGLPLAFVKSQLAPLMYGPRTLRERPELVEEFTRTANGYPRDGLARASLAVVVKRTNILERLDQVKTPTMVVCGRDDRATPPARSEAIAAMIPGAKLVWIEESGHMSAIERPSAVNAVLVPFVREHVGQSSKVVAGTPHASGPDA